MQPRRSLYDFQQLVDAMAAIAPDIMKVQFWGVRGSDPITNLQMQNYGGDTTCLALEAAGQLLIFDVGSGFRGFSDAFLKRFSPPYPAITIFLSHVHYDHFKGMEQSPLMFNGQIPKVIWGGSYLYKGDHYERQFSVAEAHDKAFSYPLSPGLAQLHIKLGHTRFESWDSPTNTINLTQDPLYPIMVKTCPLPHGDETTLGYRIETREGVLCILTDIGITLETIKNYPEIVSFINGADMLIADAMFTEEEFRANPYNVNLGHASAEAIIELAVSGNVPRVFLAHHNPRATDQELDKKAMAITAYARQYNVVASLARQGQFVDIQAPAFWNTPLNILAAATPS